VRPRRRVGDRAPIDHGSVADERSTWAARENYIGTRASAHIVDRVRDGTACSNCNAFAD